MGWGAKLKNVFKKGKPNTSAGRKNEKENVSGGIASLPHDAGHDSTGRMQLRFK